MLRFRSFVLLPLLSALLAVLPACGPEVPREEIDVKRDFEYLYGVMEFCFETAVAHVRRGQADRGLDLCEARITEQEQEIEGVGRRLNSIILTPEESQEIVRFNQRYETLHGQHVDYLEANFTPEQKDRFVELVVAGIAKRFTDQLVQPTSTWAFFRRAIRW